MRPKAKVNAGGKVARLIGNLDKPEKALKQIGALLLAQSQKAFRNESWDGKRWPARRVPNVFGIIADFSLDGRASPPKRRFESSPVLKDTGRLRQSMSFALVGKDSVDVGTNMSYASVHNFGGPVESLPITRTVQEKLAKFLKRTAGKVPLKSNLYAGVLERLLRPSMTGKTLKAKVPARQFVGINKEAVERIHQLVGIHVMEAK